MDETKVYIDKELLTQIKIHFNYKLHNFILIKNKKETHTHTHSEIERERDTERVRNKRRNKTKNLRPVSKIILNLFLSIIIIMNE